MKFRINWKAGILSGVVFAIAGILFFIIIGSSVDNTCKNTSPGAPGCGLYLGVNRVISGYSDVWRSIFAPECVGGQGPDSCLGPDAGIMLATLFVLGFAGGVAIWRPGPPKLTLKIERSKLL